MADPILVVRRGDTVCPLLPESANPHGPTTAATGTGTGRTVAPQTMAEGVSRIGVSAFMADVKRDPAGIRRRAAVGGGPGVSRRARPEPRVARMSADIVFSNRGLHHSGGMERYLLTLIEGLHARGIRPVVVARRFDASLPEHGWVEPVRLPTWGLSGVLRDLLFDRRLRGLKRRRGWRALVALNPTAAADIAVCGGTHPGFLDAMGRPASRTDRMAIALEGRCFRGAGVVIAHSRFMAAQVEHYHGVPSGRIEMLYPPVDEARFHPVTEERRRELRDRLGLPRDRAVFLLASTGHGRKGLDVLVRTLGHSDLPVLLAVAGRPVDVQAPNLRYLGYRRDIEDVYRAVDCTVLASRFEPFGLVGVESVLCGTPLVGACGMGVMEVLQGDAALPFDLDVPGSLEAAVDAALARWRDGTLTLREPRRHVGYDPSVDSHLDALLGWVERLSARP